MKGEEKVTEKVNSGREVERRQVEKSGEGRRKGYGKGGQGEGSTGERERKEEAR